MPSMLLKISSASTPIIAATSPDSSSLSVNINSVTEIVSFSFTIGITRAESIASMQLRWLRYWRRVERLSFVVSTCPQAMPYSWKRS